MTAESVNASQSRWLRTRRLEHEVYAIDDNGQDLMYLVIGRQRCLLIDTGFGVGDLPSLVRSLASVPVQVVNSHGHVDHVTGNSSFPVVYVGEGDLSFIDHPLAEEQREAISARLFKGPLPETFDRASWATRVAGSIVPVREGYVFDLGVRALEVIALPGHTRGSICLLDRSARYLFTGDSIHGQTVWLHLKDSTPLHEYRDSLLHVRQFAGAFDHILPGHARLEGLPLPASILDDLIAGVGQIVAGKITGRPETTFAGDGLRCDFGTCGVLYRPDNL